MKKIIAAFLLFVIVAGGIFGYRYYPIYRTWKGMEDSMELKGAFSIKKEALENQDPDSCFYIPESAMQILSFIENGTFQGEYRNGVFHGFLYKDGVETAMMEVYRTEDDRYLLNIGQLLAWKLNDYTNTSGISLKWLSEFVDSSMNFYLSGEQLTKLMNAEAMAEEIEANMAEKKLSDMTEHPIACLKLANILHMKTVKTENGENMAEIDGLQIELDENTIPVYVKGTLWKCAEDKEKITVPEEVDLSEEQIQFIRMVLQKIAEISE